MKIESYPVILVPLVYSVATTRCNAGCVLTDVDGTRIRILVVAARMQLAGPQPQKPVHPNRPLRHGTEWMRRRRARSVVISI